MPNSRDPEHKPTLRRSPALTRAEYAERGKQLYQLVPAPLWVNALLLLLVVATGLLTYGDVGPPALAARLGLSAVLLVVILGGAFVFAHEIVRRRLRRLGLLCPSCGRHPLGIRRFRYSAKEQIEKILECGHCEQCGNKLFHADA